MSMYARQPAPSDMELHLKSRALLVAKRHYLRLNNLDHGGITAIKEHITEYTHFHRFHLSPYFLTHLSLHQPIATGAGGRRKRGEGKSDVEGERRNTYSDYAQRDAAIVSFR